MTSDTTIYTVVHPLIRDILLNVFGNFPRPVGNTVAIDQARPPQLAQKNVTKHGKHM